VAKHAYITPHITKKLVEAAYVNLPAQAVPLYQSQAVCPRECPGSPLQALHTTTAAKTMYCLVVASTFSPGDPNIIVQWLQAPNSPGNHVQRREWIMCSLPNSVSLLLGPKLSTTA
jgi:hypothetical protein